MCAHRHRCTDTYTCMNTELHMHMAHKFTCASCAHRHAQHTCKCTFVCTKCTHIYTHMSRVWLLRSVAQKLLEQVLPTFSHHVNRKRDCMWHPKMEGKLARPKVTRPSVTIWEDKGINFPKVFSQDLDYQQFPGLNELQL